MLPPGHLCSGSPVSTTREKVGVSDWREANNSPCHSYNNATTSSLPSRVRAIVHQAE